MITVHRHLGVPSEGLRRAVAATSVVIGGHRRLDELAVPEDRRIVPGGLTSAVEEIRQLPEDTDVVILASGNPLWFGVIRRLRSVGLCLKVATRASSVAETFARIELPWDDAITVSARGRPIDAAITAARHYAKVAVVTDLREPLSQLASPLAGLDQTFVLAKRLGEDNEHVRIMTGEQLAAVEGVRNPNVMLVLERRPDAEWDETAVDTTAPRHVTVPEVAVERLTANALAELTVGQVPSSEAARTRAAQIGELLGGTHIYGGPATEGLRQAFDECDLVVSHLAIGATTRILAPLLDSKKTDPDVVIINQGGHFVVPLLDGRVSGANELIEELSETLSATTVLTTATDSLGIPVLDTLGQIHSGDVTGMTGAMPDDHSVQLVRGQPRPMPPLPTNVIEDTASPVAEVLITDRDASQLPAAELPRVVLHPRSLVMDMGCSRSTSEKILRIHLEAALASAGLTIHSVVALASADAKVHEGGLIRLAEHLGAPFVRYRAAELAGIKVPTPSEAVVSEVGTPSVSEASVIRHDTKLIVPKMKYPDAAYAIGRVPARGELRVIGLDPGRHDLLTPITKQAIETARYMVGCTPYVRQIRDLVNPHVEIRATKIGTEEQRTAFAIQKAREGHPVTSVCSGGPAIYAMASPTLEIDTEGIDVRIIPGVTAELTASALLGAPLGYDRITISLSDLHTSWEDTERRFQAAAGGDFMTVLYNPRSHKRVAHLPRALGILGVHCPAGVPVVAVYEAFRPEQRIRWAPISEFNPEWADIHTIVIVGSPVTESMVTGVGETAIVTPRNYQWMGKIQGGNC